MNDLRQAAMTIRAHTQRIVKPQTVAEHSYHVAMLCWRLCDREPSAELLKAALFHDLAESITGDVPATAKWLHPALKNALEDFERQFDHENHLYVPLKPNEENILKWADGLELMAYCVDEIRMGNQFVDTMYRAVLAHVEKLPPIKNGISLLNEIKTDYAIAKTGRSKHE